MTERGKKNWGVEDLTERGEDREPDRKTKAEKQQDGGAVPYFDSWRTGGQAR